MRQGGDGSAGRVVEDNRWAVLGRGPLLNTKQEGKKGEGVLARDKEDEGCGVVFPDPDNLLRSGQNGRR